MKPRPKVLPVVKGHEASQIESSPKTSRTKVSSEGKSLSASQNESGATTAGPMSEFLTVMLKNIEEINIKMEKLDKLLVRRGNKLDDMVKIGPEYQSASCWTAASGSAATSCHEGRRTRRQEDSRKYGGLRTRREIRRYLVRPGP